jgi:hypothetical protein
LLSESFGQCWPAAGVVCLTETPANKDIIATVNGYEQLVLTAKRAFKAVYLAQAGDYHIEFAHQPRYWPARGLPATMS